MPSVRPQLKTRRTAAPASAKRRRKAPRSFVPADALAFALATLAAPPARPGIARRDGVGALVARWLLPLSDAPTANRLIELGRAGPWALEELKKRVRKRMLDQCGGRRAREPLPGRPMIRIIIFSHAREDYDRSRTKIIVDRLQRGEKRRPRGMPPELWERIEEQAPPVDLGWIRDDSVKAIDLATWQEPCAPGKGCVLVELYTGEAS